MGFVGSKPFIVAVALAALVLLAGAGAYAVGRSTLGARADPGCSAPSFAAGHALAPSSETARALGGRTSRVITYDLPANATVGFLDACAVVGDVAVSPSTDGRAHVVFTITARSADAAQRTEVGLALADARLGAWQATVGKSVSLFGESSASADVRVELPSSSGAFDARLESDVGDVALERLLVGNLTAGSTTGDVTLTDLDLAGDLKAATSTGDVRATLASVQPGNLSLRSATGDITLRLPTRADVGYDATADTSTGDASVDLGPTEVNERSHDDVGGHVHARSAGYSAKPTQAVVTAETSTGDVRVEAR